MSLITKRKELTPFQRGQISGLHIAEWSVRDIAEKLKIPKSTVQYTIQHEGDAENGAYDARVGRPSIITPRTERLILRKIKENPILKYSELAGELPEPVSRDTLQKWGK